MIAANGEMTLVLREPGEVRVEAVKESRNYRCSLLVLRAEGVEVAALTEDGLCGRFPIGELRKVEGPGFDSISFTKGIAWRGTFGGTVEKKELGPAGSLLESDGSADFELNIVKFE
jgi:hypothetical protein